MDYPDKPGNDRLCGWLLVPQDFTRSGVTPGLTRGPFSIWVWSSALWIPARARARPG